MVSAVAPKRAKILSMNRYPEIITKPLMIMVNTMLLPKIFSAQFTSFLPNTMDMRAEEPTPISAPKAWTMFMMGMVMAKPAIAKAPTP